MRRRDRRYCKRDRETRRGQPFSARRQPSFVCFQRGGSNGVSRRRSQAHERAHLAQVPTAPALVGENYISRIGPAVQLLLPDALPPAPILALSARQRLERVKARRELRLSFPLGGVGVMIGCAAGNNKYWQWSPGLSSRPRGFPCSTRLRRVYRWQYATPQR